MHLDGFHQMEKTCLQTDVESAPTLADRFVVAVTASQKSNTFTFYSHILGLTCALTFIFCDGNKRYFTGASHHRNINVDAASVTYLYIQYT